MKITYIGHSGFLIEWETCYWLFDYFKGELPEFNLDKKIFVFSSHKHEDHFNPVILKLYEKYHNIEFVLSSDIKISKEKLNKLGIAEEVFDRIVSVKPSNQYELYDESNNVISLKTLKSTDCGVAFLLQYQGKTIYHAGDLHLWVWPKATKQENSNMTAKFQKEMKELKDITIDIAFVPLDPRLEEYYYMGLENLLTTAKVRYVFPMHLWEKYSVIQQFKSERATVIDKVKLMDINQGGQKWELEI